MFNNKTFSLVFPAYNEETHIRKNIESFLNTNIFDEIIVVDNNSQDETEELITTNFERVIFQQNSEHKIVLY